MLPEQSFFMKTNLTFSASVLSLLLVLLSCNFKHTRNVSLSNRSVLDFIVDSYVENGAYPVIQVHLENLDGSVLYEHSAVNKKLIPDQKIDSNTWFRIWSMSKIVTISIVLDLIEEGKLKLSDPVTRYIPEFKNLQVAIMEDGRPLRDFTQTPAGTKCAYKLVPMDSTMTVLHLLNHEAGFYYATTGIKCLDSLIASQDLATSKTSQEYITRIAKLPLVQQPGSKDFYGTNTTILGFVAERATEKSLKALVEERIARPLNISGLQYSLPGGAKLLPAFYGKDSVLRQAKPGELDIYGAHTINYDPAHQLYLGGEGMIATSNGYIDFLRMLLNNGALNNARFLNESSVKDLYAPHTQLNSPYGYNGYNLWVNSDFNAG